MDRTIPCELTKVMCVGALSRNQVSRSVFSSFGSLTRRPGNDTNTVDIYAEGEAVNVGPDPWNPGGLNQVGQPQTQELYGG